jgi:large subunit ribosomal protein L24
MSARIKKNDEVTVIAGDSRGARGKVLFVDTARSRAIVEGVNIGVKHSKATGSVAGGRLQREFSVHLSNLSKV